MARLPRLYAPSIVQHVVQRPADGRQLFVGDDSYALFTTLLADAVREQRIALHAYVLTPDELRLLVTPHDATSVGRALQSIGRRYVPWINRATGRPGPLWGRRYRSTLLDADAYLLDSMRFVEALPVTLGLVASPSQWSWSSHAHHVGDAQQPWINDHAMYWGLSDTPFERQATYRRLAGEPVDPAVAARIAGSVEGGWLLGDAKFAEAIADRLNRRGAALPRGRPRRDRPVPI